MNDDRVSGESSPPPQGSEESPDLFEVYITVSRESFAALMQKFPRLDLGCRPHIDLNPDGTGDLQVFASEESIREIEAAGYRVQKGQNVSALGRERQKEVGVGDRYQGGRVIPRGPGRKPGGRR
ncbi:MAG TPA: hypothetical protein VK900_07915 [Anaerolineales bacterium]|nr:hypothetical protein [Anaerolineales bacterium]